MLISVLTPKVNINSAQTTFYIIISGKHSCKVFSSCMFGSVFHVAAAS
jgi:hypothetical protein